MTYDRSIEEFIWDYDPMVNVFADLDENDAPSYDGDFIMFDSRVVVDKMLLHYGISAETTNRVLKAVADELKRG